MEVLFSAPECYGISHGAGCGDIVNHLLPGNAEEFVVEQLKVLFLCERNLLKVLYGFDAVNLYMALLKHPAVILGMSLQVFQGLFEQPFLEGFYLFRAFEFYVLLHHLERHVVEPGDKLREPVLGFFCILFRVHTKAVTAFSVLDIVMRHVFGA